MKCEAPAVPGTMVLVSSQPHACKILDSRMTIDQVPGVLVTQKRIIRSTLSSDYRLPTGD